ncbi:MAG: hypothetical protein ACJ735_02705 [Actinomycetes bacterium]
MSAEMNAGEHVVFFAAADGSPAFRRLSSLQEAVDFVEHMRNEQGVTDVSVHSLTEVQLAFRTVYRVEVAGSVPAPSAPVEAVPVAEPVAAEPLVAEPVAEPEAAAQVAAVAEPEMSEPVVEPMAEPMADAAPMGDVVPAGAESHSLGFFAG